MSRIIPTENALVGTIDHQDASSFFTIPIELRRAIYGHLFDLSAGQHIQYISDGNDPNHFRLTPCIAPGRSDEEGIHALVELCKSKGLSWYNRLTYSRRLASTWGPHWMCEELAFNLPGGSCQEGGGADAASARDLSSAMRVCRRMYIDLIELGTRTTDFHVADMKTLRALMDDRQPAPVPFSFKGSIHPRIASLSIFMSLPLEFFEAVEAASPARDQNESSPSASGPEDDVDTWLALPTHLPTQLPSLRKLQIWLNHNDKNSWSAVNERAMLAPIEEIKAGNPDIELVCVLPKGQGYIEDKQGVNKEKESCSRLEIYRILPQRYRVSGLGCRYASGYQTGFQRFL